MKKFAPVIIALLLAVAVVIILLGSNTIHTSAQLSDQQAANKHYVSYKVKSGDTLWSIAEEHAEPEYGTVSEYLSEIKDINGISGSRITAGAKLIIVCYE